MGTIFIILFIVFIKHQIYLTDSSPVVFIPHVVEGIIGNSVQFSLQFQTADNNSIFTVSKLEDNDKTTELIRVSQNVVQDVNITWAAINDVIIDLHGERCRVNVTLRNLQFPVHEGYYRATITGSDGTESAVFFIRTIAHPEKLQLRKQPSNPISGSDVTFICTGNTGRPKPIVILLQSLANNEQTLVQVGADFNPTLNMLVDGRYVVNASFVRRVTFSDNGTFFACDIRYRIGLSQRLNNATSNLVPINIPGATQNQVNILVTTTNIQQGVHDLKITCSASGSYSNILQYIIKKNDSSPTLKTVVTTKYVIGGTPPLTTTWGDTNVEQRATLSGNPLPNGDATLVMTIPKEDVLCPADAGGYQCEFNAVQSSGNAPIQTSPQVEVNVQTTPAQMNPMTVLANTGSGNVPVTNYRFTVGTVLTLQCTGQVGNPVQTPRWCHKKTSDFGWQSPASGVSNGEATVVGCQNSMTTTYVHNVTSDDNSRTFQCEAGTNPQCGFGDVSSNITMFVVSSGGNTGQQSPEDGSSDAGVIAGAVIGSIAFLVIVALIIYFLIFRRKSSAPQSGTNNAGVIAGAIVGSLVGIILILVLVWFFVFRDRASGDTYRTKEDQPGRNGQPEMTREGPVYSVPHRDKVSRDHHEDNIPDNPTVPLKKPELHYAENPTVPLKKQELHYADVEIATRPPGTQEKTASPAPGHNTGTVYASVEFV